MAHLLLRGMHIRLSCTKIVHVEVEPTHQNNRDTREQIRLVDARTLYFRLQSHIIVGD